MARRPAEFLAGTLCADAAVAAGGVGGVAFAPTVGGVLCGPGLHRAQLQSPGNGAADLRERGFAVLNEVERAGGGLAHGPQVQLGAVFDVHVGPTIDALTDNAHHAGFARLVHQTGDLHAAGVQPGATAVDVARAEHYCANTLVRSIEHAQLDVAAQLLGGLHDERRVLVEDVL